MPQDPLKMLEKRHQKPSFTKILKIYEFSGSQTVSYQGWIEISAF